MIAVLSACTVQADGRAKSGDVEQLGPKGPVPAGLAPFYGQKLIWRDCRPLAHDDESRGAFARRGVRCALLTVPLDYAKPDGTKISIGLLRTRATGDRIGVLLINPGGPGVSGMSAAATISSRIADSEVEKRFDLVGFDPRGIGASEPTIRCLTGEETDLDRLEPANATVEAEEAENRSYAEKCAQRSGGPELLANVGTRDVVRDMDVMRSALGEEKLTYLGYSYGTRIGTAYAEAFPANVRAMVLDGAVDPLEDPAQQVIGQAKGFDKALADFFAWCGQQRSCAVRDKTALRALLDPLDKAPIAVANGRKLSEGDATTAIAAALYNDELWTFLAAALSGLAAGEGENLMLLADTYMGRAENGEYSGTLDALVAIRCVDEPRITDRAVLAQVSQKVVDATKDTFLADTEPPLAALDPCAFWPVPNTSSPHQPKVDGVPPLLVISTTGDPATPYQAGVNLAKALNASLLTYEATQHTIFLQNDECIDTAGTRYLVDLALPAPDTRCTG